MDTAVNWDREASKYQDVFERCGSNDYNKNLISFFINELGLEAGQRVIDIGCGVGKYGTMFAALGCNVSLTDISSEMLRHAKENMASYPVEKSFLCCDFNDVSLDEPFFKDGFDLAISTMSPAIHDENTLRKMSAISRGWCFTSNFCDWQQPARDRYYKLLGTAEEHTRNVPLMNDRISESIQIIKSLGYEPYTRVVDYNWTDLRTPEDAVKRLSGEDLPPAEFERNLNIVKSLCSEKGEFVDTVNTRVTWLYWKV